MNKNVSKKDSMVSHMIACESEIYSYAQDTSEPILFQHFKYKHDVQSSVQTTTLADSYIIYIFLSGKFFFILDDSIFHPSYGDIVLLPKDGKLFHGIYTISDLDYFQISLPRSFFIKTEWNHIFRALFDYGMTPRYKTLSLDEGTVKRIISKLEKTETIINTDEYDKLFAYSYIIQIIYTIFQSCKTLECNNQEVKLPSLLLQALAYIHAHYLTIQNLSEVAKHCGISTTYLGILFKKNVFMSTNKYIVLKRIAHAKYLLSQGFNVTDACYESGFNSYPYFIQFFKKQVGMTPYRYRQQMLAMNDD